MYAALWRALPGPLWVRVLSALLLGSAILIACIFWIFPFVLEILPQQVVTVDGQ